MRARDAIVIEVNRVRVLIGILDGSPDASVAVRAMRELVKRSEAAIAEHDDVECLRCLGDLRGIHL